MFALFPHPRRLRAVSWPLALGIRPSRLAPRVSFADMRAAPDPVTPARGERRMSVALLQGCVQRVFFGRVNRASAEALAGRGCEVVVPPGQGCCGALALHAGREVEARKRALATIAALRGHDRVVVTAAGCGSAMKEYGELLGTDEARRFSASVRDVTELLAELGPPVPEVPDPSGTTRRVVYQDACHLRHAQGVREQPRELLRAVPGLELVEIEGADTCCGSAGIYNLTQPEAARELGRRKAQAILRRPAGRRRHGEPGLRASADGGAARPGAGRPAGRPPGRAAADELSYSHSPSANATTDMIAATISPVQPHG